MTCEATLSPEQILTMHGSGKAGKGTWLKLKYGCQSELIILLLPIFQLGEQESAPWSLNCGVPKGSIISPMLFNIYMRLLGEVIRGCGASCHQYADDTQLYISFLPTTVDAVAPATLPAVCTAMDAGKWAEAEPG